MKPIGFKEQTKVLQPPVGQNEDECGKLPVFADGNQVISLWELTWKERFALLFRGRIWLGVVSGYTQPPVWLDTSKTVFVSESDNGGAE